MKHIVVINGVAQSGKDTVCDIVAAKYKTMNISSIDLVKEYAKKIGWDGVKDEKGRKLLCLLKQTLTEYDDLPMKDCLEKCKEFLESNKKILFVHIREPEEIERFINAVKSYSVPTHTILVKRKKADKRWNNSSDDRVSYFDYDYVIENNGTLKTLSDKTLDVFETIVGEESSTLCELAYELYKAEWMARITTGQKKEAILNYFKDSPNCTFNEYIHEHGYNGMLYVCYDEFAECEYLDSSFMRRLLNDPVLYEQYKKEMEEMKCRLT